MSIELALQAGTLLAALAALILVAIVFIRQRSAAPSSEAIGQLVRAECEVVRHAGDENARALRGELSDSFEQFRDGVATSFRTILEYMSSQLKEFDTRVEGGVQSIDRRVDAMASKLNDDLKLLGIEANLGKDQLRQLVEAKLDDSVSKQSASSLQFRQEMEASFDRLRTMTAETLQGSSTQQNERLDKSTLAITQFGEKQERSAEQLKDSVERRLEAIREESAKKLEEMRQVVDEKLQTTLETRLSESFNRVVEQLKSVHEGIGEMRKLAENVGDLQKVLTNVKVRGTYGEVQLALLLEEFLSPEQYVKDAVTKDGTLERVEYAIRMPGGDFGEVLLPIDAKFPREDYEKLCEAIDAGDMKLVAMFRKQLENRIKSCARDIRDKYINVPRTTDFGILFIPTESIYAEVLRQPGLFEAVHREFRVAIASPTTLSALLNALQMGFRSLALQKRSSEVWQVLGAVRTEFGKYNDVVDTLGKQLDRAVNSVGKLGQRTRAMSRTLRGVEALPDDPTTQRLLGLDAENEIHPDEVEALPGQSDSASHLHAAE
jgi:DNA recombination protein RmuC